MNPDVVKVLVAVAATVIAALVLYPLQQGGLRKRIRRDLLDELLLLERLSAAPDHKAHTEQIQRIQDNADRLVRRYAPDPDRDPGRAPKVANFATVGLCLLLLLTALFASSGGVAAWMYCVAGAVSALLGEVAASTVRWWQDGIEAAGPKSRRRSRARASRIPR